MVNKINRFPNYKIDNLGNVFRSTRGPRTHIGKELKQNLGKDGYYRVFLYKNNKKYTIRIHTLLADAFLGIRPFNYEINHKDGNKKNNNINNLEYITKKENIQHAFKLGLISHKKGAESPNCVKLNLQDFLNKSKEGASQRNLAKEFNISKGLVYYILKGINWRTNNDIIN